MKPGIEEKITRVYQHYDIKKKGRKKVISGPYWLDELDGLLVMLMAVTKKKGGE